MSTDCHVCGFAFFPSTTFYCWMCNVSCPNVRLLQPRDLLQKSKAITLPLQDTDDADSRNGACWACSECTFLNSVGLERCEVCDTSQWPNMPLIEAVSPRATLFPTWADLCPD